MPFQNRVTPAGHLITTSARGLFMGNRGGRLHNPEHRTLETRRWVSKAWIICLTRFKNRHRSVWGTSYTELFFLDEVTAFAAGHRPCFECRNRDAKAFARAAQPIDGTPTRAADLDSQLHQQRLTRQHDSRHRKRTHVLDIDVLPDGAVIEIDGGWYALMSDRLLRWTPTGYEPAMARPAYGRVTVLTPPLTLNALNNGYEPVWHASHGTALNR